MRVSSRRRAITAIITVVFSMALAATVAGRGCQTEDDGPTDAVYTFLERAKAQDRDGLFAMLGPKTKARLQEAARRATALVGGEQRYSAQDMLQPLRTGPAGKNAKTIRQSADRAIVLLREHNGRETEIELVWVNRDWLIELPAETSVNDSGLDSSPPERASAPVP